MAKRRTKIGRTKNPDDVAEPTEGGSTGNDATAKKAWECWRRTRAHLRDWREDTVESYNFVAGHQWSTEDLAALEEQGRPAITFNRTEPTISAVSGYEINGRQDITFLPREPGEQGENGIAEVDTAAVKYFREQCDAEDEESDQFYDVLVAGMGWTEHRMDYDENPDGMLRVERVDPLEMGYDPAAIRRNLTDRRWDIRGKWWDKTVAKDKWPDAEFDAWVITPNATDAMEEKEPIDRMEAAFYRSPGVGEQGEIRKDKVFILEYTWFEQEPFYTVVNPTTGKADDIEPALHKRLQERLKEAGMPEARSVKRTRRKFRRAFVYGPDTLEDEDAPCPHDFHYQCITGKRDRNKNVWFGLVRAMKDPQRWANKWLSQFLHMLNTNVKNGFWYEKGAFDDVKSIEAKLGKPGFVVGVNPGYLDKIHKEEPTPIPNDAMNLMQYAIGSIRDATGVNVELLGQGQDNQTGVVEAHRKQSAMTILAPIFGAQRHYRKKAGRIELYFVKTYLSDGRWIRIAGAGNAKYVQLAKREDSGSYDVVVDESPSAPNQKEAVFGVLGMLVPQLIKMGVPIPPEILDYAPIPSSLADKWKNLIQQKQSQPAQPDPKTALAQQKLQQEAQESQQQDKIDNGRLDFDKQSAVLDARREAMEMQIRKRELDLRERELALKARELGVKQDIHITDLAADALNQHHDRRHTSSEAELDRAHETTHKNKDRAVARQTKVSDA